MHAAPYIMPQRAYAVTSQPAAYATIPPLTQTRPTRTCLLCILRAGTDFRCPGACVSCSRQAA